MFDSICDCVDMQSSTQQGATSSEGPREVVKKAKLSLFDDDDDDDDADLFAVSSSATSKTAKPTAADTSKVHTHTLGFCLTVTFSTDAPGHRGAQKLFLDHKLISYHYSSSCCCCSCSCWGNLFESA